MGTVELKGLEMTRMCAFGATRPIAFARSRMMEAFVYGQSAHATSVPVWLHKEVITGHLGVR